MNSKHRIQTLNALGPYVHGVWENRNQKIGSEESQQGRSEFILKNFQNFMQLFQADEIKEMTCLDVGGYDGWMANQIKNTIPFKKVYTLEPREKSIQRGKYIRNYLNIKQNFTIIKNTLEGIASSSKSKFDIVFCAGVIHHTPSTLQAITNLAKLSKKGIFIETLIYEEPNILFKKRTTKKLVKVLEPKDIAYISSSIPTLGMSGHKYETNYSDGSASETTIVELPDIDLIKMSLRINNFTNNIVHASPQIYRKNLKLNKSSNATFRKLHAVIISSRPVDKESFLLDSAEKYENFFLLNSLNFKLLSLLYKKNERNKLRFYLSPNKFVRELSFVILPFNYTTHRLSSIEKKLINSVLINFESKHMFELAKHNLLNGPKKETTIEILVGITQKINCDWRVSYRSYAILHVLYKSKGNFREAARYKRLLQISNPNFPMKSLSAVKKFYKL
jgi:2-polyprenyl-3-methyl-5-hydroxy-6-metoxy-1,4-benzoquinol methylase